MEETKKESVSGKNKVFQWIRDFFEQWELQTMVWPAIIFMIIFNFIPIYGLTIAFKRYTVIDSLDTAPWVGLDNFRIILNDKFFWHSVVNTLGISFLKLVIGFVLPIILAILIFELRQGPFKKLVQTISYMPYFLSWIVLGGMLINWLSTTGLLNTILSGLGFQVNHQNYLLSADKYWWIAVLSDIWKNTGWGTILYLATMSKIDPTYYEAAKIDGATRFQQITKITLPMLKGIVSLNLILTISGLLGSNLDQTMVLMNNQNQRKAEVINSYVYRMGIAQGDFSYATAVGLGVSIISVILLVLSNQFTKRINDNQSVL
ncbi:MAG TPA: ABC transporter permease subunit [Candidatus Tetragenococcus pullicola]|nr:ABC transporter permease subunit [Candidatus Tetragenococcus pullicola]